MKLTDFYAHIAPFLLGESGHDVVAAALWGRDPPQPDAERLRIYGRFCQNHRAETLDGVFTACRRVVLASPGAAAWTQLIEDYFRAHPMHHFELNRNGEHFADFLAGECARPPGLPPFLAELADLDWWEWQVISAPDEPSDAEPGHGPLRLHSTVEVRPYAFDFVRWLDDYAAADRPPAPEAEPTTVLFWRDGDLEGRREKVVPLEMMILKAVLESVPLDRDLAARLGVTAEALAETAADLHAAGVLLGDSALLPG